MPDLKYHFIMPRHLAICWIFAVVFLASCSSEPLKNRSQLEVRAQPQRRMPPPPAVKSYGLADDQSSSYLLNADTFIQSGEIQSAQNQLDLVQQAQLSPEQRGKFSLLVAQIALSMGDAEQALQKLKNARPALLSPPDKVNYYQSLAFAHLLMGDVLPGVSARIKLGNLLQNPKQQQANIAAILDMLSVLPEETLTTRPEMADELNGWMALAKILKQRSQTGVDISEQIQQWRQNYPGHPANAEFLQAYLSHPPAASQSDESGQEQVEAQAAGATIAVLLPTSGPYAPAGKAIKEGLMAAYRIAASAAPQIPLKFYDSAEEDIAVLYQQAVAEGAKQVIGPLIKEQIQELAQNVEMTVPVLALNHVENLSQNNLYQLGLSPIDEADALAIKAQGEGRQSALILVPNTAQGERIGNYLASSWQSHGGIVAGMQNYDPKQHDIVDKFNQLVNASTYPDGQQPARAVLLSANADTARELAPQLKYHQNTNLAVYAMPSIYSGRLSPVRDAEMGSFQFCDVPWLFADYYAGPLSQSALQDSWQGLSETVTRLIALGIDAYNIVGHLDQLASTPYAGATGQLALSGDNRISRKLVCAQFKGGVPVATGFAK